MSKNTVSLPVQVLTQPLPPITLYFHTPKIFPLQDSFLWEECQDIDLITLVGDWDAAEKETCEAFEKTAQAS